MNIPKRIITFGLTELDVLILDNTLRERIESGELPGAATQNCLEAIHSTLEDQCVDVLCNRELIARLLEETWNKHKPKLLKLFNERSVAGFGAELVALLNEWNKNCGAEAKMATDWPAVTEAIAYGRWDELVLCYGCAGYVELFDTDAEGELIGWCLKMSDMPA